MDKTKLNMQDFKLSPEDLRKPSPVELLHTVYTVVKDSTRTLIVDPA